MGVQQANIYWPSIANVMDEHVACMVYVSFYREPGLQIRLLLFICVLYRQHLS